MPFRSPSLTSTPNNISYPYGLEDIYALGTRLGWPWKESEMRPFNNVFQYLGLRWNNKDRTVAITKQKKDEIPK